MQFNPKLAKPKANLIAGTKVSNGVYRFRAEVSSIKDGWKDALEACLGSDLKLVRQACFQVEGARQSGVGHTIEAFAVYAPTSHFVSKGELANVLEELNAKKVAANLYMDDHETVWKVTEAGNSVTISKEGTDDIEELLASANRNHHNHSFTSHMNKAGLGEIVFVADNGMIEAGLAVGRVKGDLERVQAYRVEDLLNNGKNAEPIVISTLQVVAFEEFQDLEEIEDFETLDPVDYWRSVYSNDPEMLRTLETHADQMNLMV